VTAYLQFAFDSGCGIAYDLFRRCHRKTSASLRVLGVGLMDATLESEVLSSHRAIEVFDFTAHEMVNNDLFFEMKAHPTSSPT
jgi:hypothetical protein